MNALQTPDPELSDFELVRRALSSWKTLEANFDNFHHCLENLQTFENSDLLYVVLNHKAEIIYLNPAGADQLGVKRTDIIGNCWITGYIPSEQRTEIMMAFEVMMKGHDQVYSEYINDIIGRDNNQRLYAWKNYLVRNDDEIIIGILSSGLCLKHF